MTCAELDDRLDAWLLGVLPRADVDALEAHLLSCVSCRVLAEDVRLLQREARLIGSEGPPAGAWDRLASELQRRLPAEQPQAHAMAHRPPTSWRWTGVAALLAVLIGGSLLILRQSLSSTGTGAPVVTEGPAAAPSLVESIEFELDQAAQHYERAVAGLEQVASESDSPLDPALTATLRENLQMIDQAIADSRDALRTEPTSQLAQQSLFDAFRRKVVLLQDTIALMNEMRKGNQAGATAIASGLNKG